MKIGILTYHRAHNYGAVLQAIATRVFLKNMGYNSFYIDYYPAYHKAVYFPFSVKEIIHLRRKYGWLYIKEHLLHWKEYRQRYDNFERFIRKYIKPYCKTISEPYDLVIYGSDQIWRKQRWGIGYNPIYFGDNTISAKRKIAYAASMGILPLHPEEENINDLFNNFDAISVREKSLQSFLVSLGYPRTKLCLDPTLLLDVNDWEQFKSTISTEEEYVLLYHLQQNAFDVEKVRLFARKLGCQLKIIQGDIGESNKECQNVVGPEDFISLIANARCVLSSSFHGVVFSVIFNKPFYASLIANADRVKNLLEQLGLNDNFIDGKEILELSYPYIDYMEVNMKLEKIRRSSYSYLLEQLAYCQNSCKTQ